MSEIFLSKACTLLTEIASAETETTKELYDCYPTACSKLNALAGTCKTCQVHGNSICKSVKDHQKDWRLARLACTMEVYIAEGWLVKRNWFHALKGGVDSILSSRGTNFVGFGDFGCRRLSSMHGLEITRMCSDAGMKWI